MHKYADIHTHKSAQRSKNKYEISKRARKGTTVSYMYEYHNMQHCTVIKYEIILIHAPATCCLMMIPCLSFCNSYCEAES